MTTNQTIDGVPRELLKQALRIAEDVHFPTDNYETKLRALLDGPCPFPGYPPVPEDRKLPAFQPQGEQVACMPVERCYDVRVKMIIAFNEAKKAGGDLDEALDAVYKSALRYSPNPASAEQPAPVAVVLPFQSRVQPWMMACFGEAIAADRQERNHRFLEEALELVQANQCTASEAHQLVDYVYGRPVGEPSQEVGGVMVTLAALCLAHGMDMHASGETELARIWTKVEQIRAKQAAKPALSPLPGAYPDRPTHAAPPPGTEPSGKHHDNDGLDEMRKPK